MAMNLGYVINTHVDYGAAVAHLLATMSHVPANRKIVVVGGCETRQVKRHLGSWTVYTQQNSFDYTGLIELLPDFGDFEWIFPLQDTMEFGKKSDEWIQEGVDQSNWATAVFGGQCNLVLYRTDWLATQGKFICSMLNCSKLQSVQKEGALWNHCPEERRGVYTNSGIQIDDKARSPYGSDVARIREYYYRVDLVKWKANWGQNMETMVTKP